MASIISINIMTQTNSSCFGKILVYNSKFTSIPVDRKVISWRQCSPPPPHYSFCTQFPNPVRKSGGNYYRPNILLREQIQTPTLNFQLMQVFYWSSQNYSQMIIIVQLLYNLAPARQSSPSAELRRCTTTVWVALVVNPHPPSQKLFRPGHRSPTVFYRPGSPIGMII